MMMERSTVPQQDLRPRAAPGSTRVRLRDFSRSLPMALLRAREAVMRHFRPSLRAFDITEQQWRVLRALSSIAEIEVTELAKATFLLAPSLSRILRDLEERGLTKRRTPAKDMRLALVSISPAGMKLIEEAGVYSEEIYAEMTRRFGAAKLTELMELLRELEALLGDADLIGAAKHIAREDQPLRKRGRPQKVAADDR
jgi:homoprotocatechuate degradation regulator HpaR